MVRAPQILRRPFGLRPRLTLSYVIFFTVLLIGLGLLFRQTLQSILHSNTSAILDEEWAAVKGYLRIEKNRPVWRFDPEDSEEAFIVRRLRRVFLLADSEGRVLEVSDAYSYIGVESKEEMHGLLSAQKPVWRVRKDEDGVSYLLRSGVLTDDGRKDFLLTIGRSLDSNEKILRQFTRNYFSLVPLLILALSAAGWLMAGRALSPLNDLAQAAASVTGEKLDLRIPKRGAGDELDHLIGTFNGMVDRLQNSFNQMRQFSIDASHELRTPLTAVRGQLEVALFSAKTVDQYREAILNAIEDVERLGQIVKALLHLSQAESGQVTLARENLDLSALVKDVVEQYQIPAELEGLRLTAKLTPGAIVRGDRIQLERLISNLLSNAVKYTPRGGLISVTVHNNRDEILFCVEDSGCGIAPEHLPHIFERFYRVQEGNADPERGLGLGLSFVAWIAKAHGGRVDVKSTPGVGTRFDVVLPASEAAPPPVEPEPVVSHQRVD